MKQIVVANNCVVEINAQDHLHSPDGQLLHSLDVGIERVGERVFDQALAKSVGDAFDSVLNGKVSLETKHAFDFLGVDVVRTVIVRGGVFQFDGGISQRVAHHFGDVVHRAIFKSDI